MTPARLLFPGGAIRTHRTNSARPYGFPWANVARWEPAFTKAGRKHGGDPLLLACMSVIESDSTHHTEAGTVIERYDGHDAVPSVGLMQVKLGYWSGLDPSADGYTPAGNILLAAALMADGIRRFGGWELAIANVYHPGVDPNGTTPDGYIGVLRSLLAEVRNGTQPQPQPPADPQPRSPAEHPHPYDVIGGGAAWDVQYGFLADVGLNYYAYGVGHGTTRSTQHTGDDVLWPDETELYAPAAGRVTCVGSRGEVTWGQGCGAFGDEGGGIGNITILLDSGYKLTLGHSSRAFVAYGDRVKPGQKIGASGGMNGPHTHVDMTINKGGTYWLLDPVPALRAAMGGEVPFAPAERRDVPQPSDFDVSWDVEVLRDGVPVLQRADLNAPPVATPFKKGERFQAVYIAIGNDGRPYWIGKHRGRVPLDGTKGPNWLGSAIAPECPPDRVPALLEEIAALVKKHQGGA